MTLVEQRQQKNIERWCRKNSCTVSFHAETGDSLIEAEITHAETGEKIKFLLAGIGFTSEKFAVCRQPYKAGVCLNQNNFLSAWLKRITTTPTDFEIAL